MKIILASKSPRRRRLLREVGINFKVVPSQADESKIEEENPIELTRKLAMLKAATVANTMKKEHVLVMGADTVVEVDGEILGKPKTKKEAREMLEKEYGKEQRVYTGICVINTKTGNVFSDVQKTKVRFRSLVKHEIDRILAESDVLEWAGAYKIQDHHWLIHSIEGSFTNVVGLPIERLIPLLR